MAFEIPEGYLEPSRTTSTMNVLAKIFNFCLTKALIISNYTMRDDERFNPLSTNPTKMIKHTQTIRRQITDELFECV